MTEHASPYTRLIERFQAELERLSVTVELAESPVAARLRLAAHLQAEGTSRLLAWRGDQLPVEGVLEALEVLGVEAVSPELRGARRHETLAAIESIEVGLTGADAAIAETGTLILLGGPGRPQVITQLPRRHVVLVPLSRLFPTLESWLQEVRRRGDLASLTRAPGLTLITGPSRTLDIELIPVLGVHGPRRVHVVLIDGA